MPKNEIVETGKSVDAAIDSACEKLGCSRDDCEWEIIDLPKKGFLGLKSTPAKVRVSVEIPGGEVVFTGKSAAQKISEKTNDERPVRQKREPESRRTEEKKRPETTPEAGVFDDEKITLAKDYIASILENMGLEADFNIVKEDNGACINIEGKGLGAIIGRRGETLDAVQYLASLVANRAGGDYVRVTVDCGNYRIKRKETLEALAKRLAAQVLKTNASRTLEPMNPYERRIIHATVSEIEGVSSTSVGEEPNRRVVITSPTAKPRSGVRRDFQRGGDNNRSDWSDRENRGNREDRNERGDRGAFGDRRPPRRDSRGGDRPPRQSQSSTVKSEGPPKQTPEAVVTDKLYTKIDL